jgi:hypothetical protein
MIDSTMTEQPALFKLPGYLHFPKYAATQCGGEVYIVKIDFAPFFREKMEVEILEEYAARGIAKNLAELAHPDIYWDLITEFRPGKIYTEEELYSTLILRNVVGIRKYEERLVEFMISNPPLETVLPRTFTLENEVHPPDRARLERLVSEGEWVGNQAMLVALYSDYFAVAVPSERTEGVFIPYDFEKMDFSRPLEECLGEYTPGRVSKIFEDIPDFEKTEIGKKILPAYTYLKVLYKVFVGEDEEDDILQDIYTLLSQDNP